MSGPAKTTLIRTPVHAIRERTDTSLERSGPKRTMGNRRHLLLAPAVTLPYFQKMRAALELESLVVMAALDAPHQLVRTTQSQLRQAGPFQRIECVLEWHDMEAVTCRETWETYEKKLLEQTGVRPCLLRCYPVFEIWLWLHFAPLDAICTDATRIRQQVNDWLTTLPPADLYTQTAPLLPAAITRAQELTRHHLATTPDSRWQDTPGTQLHELVLFWYKLARKKFTGQDS
ncbi:MAG: hypothetical protein G8237_14570 [Magnetococcales bacterium]|nr:hypothetical protein [Magnetococcales bacterium]